MLRRREESVPMRTRSRRRMNEAAGDWRIHAQVQSIKPVMWDYRNPTPQGAKLAFNNPLPFSATIPQKSGAGNGNEIVVSSMYAQLGMVLHQSTHFSFMIKAGCPIATREIIAELFEETVGTNGEPERTFSEVVSLQIAPARVSPVIFARVMHIIVGQMVPEDDSSTWDSISNTFHLKCVGLIHDRSHWLSDKLRNAVSRHLSEHLPTGLPDGYDTVRDIISTMAYWYLREKKQQGQMVHVTVPPVWLLDCHECRKAESQYCRVYHTNLLRICPFNNGKTLTRDRVVAPSDIGNSQNRVLLEIMLGVGEDSFNNDFGGNPDLYWDRHLLFIPGTNTVYDPLTNFPALVDLQRGHYRQLRGHQLAEEGRALAKAREYTRDPTIEDPYWNPQFFEDRGWRFS